MPVRDHRVEDAAQLRWRQRAREVVASARSGDAAAVAVARNALASALDASDLGPAAFVQRQLVGSAPTGDQAEPLCFVSFPGRQRSLALRLARLSAPSGVRMLVDRTVLVAGEEIHRGLAKALWASDAMLVLFDETYLASSWCRAELAGAQARLDQDPNYRLVLLPVDRTPVPESLRSHVPLRVIGEPVGATILRTLAGLHPLPKPMQAPPAPRAQAVHIGLSSDARRELIRGAMADYRSGRFREVDEALQRALTGPPLAARYQAAALFLRGNVAEVLHRDMFAVQCWDRAMACLERAALHDHPIYAQALAALEEHLVAPSAGFVGGDELDVLSSWLATRLRQAGVRLADQLRAQSTANVVLWSQRLACNTCIRRDLHEVAETILASDPCVLRPRLVIVRTDTTPIPRILRRWTWIDARHHTPTQLEHAVLDAVRLRPVTGTR